MRDWLKITEMGLIGSKRKSDKPKAPDNSRPMAYVLLKKYGLTGSARLIWSDVLFDLRHGVDTAKPVSVARAFGSGELADKNRYVPTTFSALDSALSFLCNGRSDLTDLSGYNFVDVGSGKGKALIAAARWPFRVLTGIELSPMLHNIAVANMSKLDLAARVRLLNEDAATLHCHDEDKVFYFFNPFTGQTLEDCIKLIARAGQVTKRYIIYVNPTEDAVYSKYFKFIASQRFQPGDVEINFYETR